MTDAGATGTRRQREEWTSLAARFREAATNARAKRERPTNPCATWAERRRARDEWNAPLSDLDAAGPAW